MSAVKAVGVGAVLVAVVAIGVGHAHHPASTVAPTSHTVSPNSGAVGVITVKCAHGQAVSVQPDTATARADAARLCKVMP